MSLALMLSLVLSVVSLACLNLLSLVFSNVLFVVLVCQSFWFVCCLILPIVLSVVSVVLVCQLSCLFSSARFTILVTSSTFRPHQLYQGGSTSSISYYWSRESAVLYRNSGDELALYRNSGDGFSIVYADTVRALRFLCIVIPVTSF